MSTPTPALLYPLRTAALGAGLWLYLFAAVLYFTGLISAAIHDSLLFIWIACAFGGLLLFLTMLFEYGMDIVETSANGSTTPPAFRASIIAGSGQSEQRLPRQILMLALIAGLGLQLVRWDYELAGWLVWTCLLLALPAALAINAIYNKLIDMLNPLSLVQCARSFGWYYPLALLLLCGAVALTTLAASVDPVIFLTMLPCCLYCWFLFFHILGSGIHRHHERFFTTVDFTADRKALEQTRASLADLNEVLSKAYEDLRAGRTEPALAAIVRHLETTAWQDFDKAFDYVREWPYREAGLHIARVCIVRATAEKRYMRALGLAEWCVERQADILVDDPGTLELLAGHAVTRGQLSAVLTLLENMLTQRPEAAGNATLRALALDIAGNRLKNERRAAALLQTP